MAGAAYFSAEAKAQRQHRDVQLGNLQLQIDAVRAEKEKLLAALSLPVIGGWHGHGCSLGHVRLVHTFRMPTNSSRHATRSGKGGT